MNSLYGRFGMQPQLHSHVFCNFDEITQLIATGAEILDYIAVSPSNLYFVTYPSETVSDLDTALPRLRGGGVSVGIASAVTAYARVFMSKFKNNPDFNLFYTDTAAQPLCR